MTIETSLQIEFEDQYYVLMIKMIRMESISYFFIRDIWNEKPFLGIQMLELTYTSSFSLTAFAGKIKSPGIPYKKVIAIQEALLANKELWF